MSIAATLWANFKGFTTMDEQHVHSEHQWDEPVQKQELVSKEQLYGLCSQFNIPVLMIHPIMSTYIHIYIMIFSIKILTFINTIIIISTNQCNRGRNRNSHLKNGSQHEETK